VTRAGGTFPGWERIDSAFSLDTSIGFKTLFIRQSGLSPENDLDELLSSILETCRTKPHRALEEAVALVVDRARRRLDLEPD
jgi:hypothetical protein